MKQPIYLTVSISVDTIFISVDEWVCFAITTQVLQLQADRMCLKRRHCNTLPLFPLSPFPVPPSVPRLPAPFDMTSSRGHGYSGLPAVPSYHWTLLIMVTAEESNWGSKEHRGDAPANRSSSPFEMFSVSHDASPRQVQRTDGWIKTHSFISLTCLSVSG